jgi:hypothetical protein
MGIAMLTPVAIIADGDYREKEIYLRGVTSLEDAQKQANYNLELFADGS